MTLESARFDVGLGTAYERVAIYQLFERWAENRNIETALEGPIDGMAGIPGLHLLSLARKGTRVTVALPDSEALEIVRSIYQLHGVEDRLTTLNTASNGSLPGGYDLVLTYNALPLVPDWRAYLKQLAERSKRFFLVSVTNPYSYGVGIRRLQRLVESSRQPELFDHESVRPSVLTPFLQQFGSIVEHTHLDCPWWPDLFVPTGQTLASASLARLPFIGKRFAARNPSSGGQKHNGVVKPYLYGADRFPLFPDGPDYKELGDTLKRHPVFDGKGGLLGQLFGHHHAYLVEIR